jgi:REP element-mobilizing transposase RayT
LAHPEAARIVIDALRWLRRQGRIRLLGFVIMPDHVHVALVLREGCTLAEIMHSWKRHAAQQIHKLTVAVGNRSHQSLWQDGYHDHLLRDRREFETKLDYMHQNPVRAELVKRGEEYPFSTAHPDYDKEIDWAWLDGISFEAGRGRNAAPTTMTPDDEPR